MKLIYPLFLILLTFIAGCNSESTSDSEPNSISGQQTATETGTNTDSDVNDVSDVNTDTHQEVNCTTATEFKDQILCEHNAVRANVQPAADPELSDLVWNDDLEAIAQEYAEQCVFEHNPNRGDNFPGTVGENLYAATFQPGARAVVSSWAGEVSEYDYDNNSCSGVCGHYTQIVWRNTTEVGCAIHQCNSFNGGIGFSSGYIVVCNYTPAGNWIGQWPY